MGQIKQLHIDCYKGVCEVNQWETCYMQTDNASYPPDPDYDPLFDEDREDINGQKPINT